MKWGFQTKRDNSILGLGNWHNLYLKDSTYLIESIKANVNYSLADFSFGFQLSQIEISPRFPSHFHFCTAITADWLTEQPFHRDSDRIKKSTSFVLNYEMGSCQKVLPTCWCKTPPDPFKLNDLNKLCHKKRRKNLTRSMVQSHTSLIFDGSIWYSATAGKRFLNLCGGEIKWQICYQLQDRANSEKKHSNFKKLIIHIFGLKSDLVAHNLGFLKEL